MKDHFQTEDTLNNKEVEGSVTENLKCLYLSNGYFAPHTNFMIFFIIFCVIFQVAKDFGFDDDSVIERLRENMHDLRSHRLDHPGRPSEDELPKKPFGLFDLPEVNEPVKKPTEWTIEREAGLRTSKFYFFSKFKS